MYVQYMNTCIMCTYCRERLVPIKLHSSHIPMKHWMTGKDTQSHWEQRLLPVSHPPWPQVASVAVRTVGILSSSGYPINKYCLDY